MAETTTIQIAKSDRPRLDNLKVHPAQPVGEIVTEALTLLERERREAKVGGKRRAS